MGGFSIQPMRKEWQLNDYNALVTFPAFRQLVQAFMDFTEPWIIARIFFKFGFQRRLVAFLA